jgi:hypothetical protein
LSVVVSTEPVDENTLSTNTEGRCSHGCSLIPCFQLSEIFIWRFGLASRMR